MKYFAIQVGQRDFEGDYYLKIQEREEGGQGVEVAHYKHRDLEAIYDTLTDWSAQQYQRIESAHSVPVLPGFEELGG